MQVHKNTSCFPLGYYSPCVAKAYFVATKFSLTVSVEHTRTQNLHVYMCVFYCQNQFESQRTKIYDQRFFLTKGDWSNIDVRGVANK